MGKRTTTTRMKKKKKKKVDPKCASFLLSFLLQLNDDHSLEQSTGLIEIKLLEYFGLLTAEEIRGLQNGDPASAA